ncbi:terminase small subunit [Kiloniella majae]|uniref:terminase small subunit n=1 Tax=Kiloniella majae TaxID=1938558 RepID=UPI000A277692|nr:terminase small subunit [Kiloniella majae]
MSLTDKQQRFVEEYLIDLNATQAAIRAGHSIKTARQIGSENLSKPDIAVAIAQGMESRSERTEINADWVLNGAVELFNKSMQHEGLVDENGDPVGEYKFNAAGAGKALDLVGKHVDVQAFKERVEHTVEGELMERLLAGRKRLNEEADGE